MSGKKKKVRKYKTEDVVQGWAVKKKGHISGGRGRADGRKKNEQGGGELVRPGGKMNLWAAKKSEEQRGGEG